MTLCTETIDLTLEKASSHSIESDRVFPKEIHLDDRACLTGLTDGLPRALNIRKKISAIATEADKKLHPGVLYGLLIDIGREITRLTVIAERAGDCMAVESLLREKDRIHRLRRELSDVAC
jgi:hypothetical protein